MFNIQRYVKILDLLKDICSIKDKKRNSQRGKGERWGSRINGVTGIGTSTRIIKGKVSTIECGL